MKIFNKYTSAGKENCFFANLHNTRVLVHQNPGIGEVRDEGESDQAVLRDACHPHQRLQCYHHLPNGLDHPSTPLKTVEF